MAQLMPLPLTLSCFSKIQIGFTFLVLPETPQFFLRTPDKWISDKWIAAYCTTVLMETEPEDIEQICLSF